MALGPPPLLVNQSLPACLTPCLPAYLQFPLPIPTALLETEKDAGLAGAAVQLQDTPAMDGVGGVAAHASAAAGGAATGPPPLPSAVGSGL